MDLSEASRSGFTLFSKEDILGFSRTRLRWPNIQGYCKTVNIHDIKIWDFNRLAYWRSLILVNSQFNVL